MTWAYVGIWAQSRTLWQLQVLECWNVGNGGGWGWGWGGRQVTRSQRSPWLTFSLLQLFSSRSEPSVSLNKALQGSPAWKTEQIKAEFLRLKPELQRRAGTSTGPWGPLQYIRGSSGAVKAQVILTAPALARDLRKMQSDVFESKDGLPSYHRSLFISCQLCRLLFFFHVINLKIYKWFAASLWMSLCHSWSG